MTAPTLSAAILAVKGATEGEWESYADSNQRGEQWAVVRVREPCTPLFECASDYIADEANDANARAIVAAVNWLKSDEPKELLAVLGEAREVTEGAARLSKQNGWDAEHARLTALLHRIDRLTAAGGGCSS
jgi:hypothetical protein